MKKFFVVLWALTLLSGTPGTTSALNVGRWYWDANNPAGSQLVDGTWIEGFTNGSPGSSGNLILTGARNDPAQWAFGLQLAQSDPTEPWTDWITPPSTGGSKKWTAYYDNGELVLNDPVLWGNTINDPIVVTGLTGVILFTTYYNTNELIGLDFLMTITGVYANLSIKGVFEFSGTIADGTYLYRPDSRLSSDYLGYHKGKNWPTDAVYRDFNRIELVITPEPGTMLLIATGLIGLIALGRSKK